MSKKTEIGINRSTYETLFRNSIHGDVLNNLCPQSNVGKKNEMYSELVFKGSLNRDASSDCNTESANKYTSNNQLRSRKDKDKFF